MSEKLPGIDEGGVIVDVSGGRMTPPLHDELLADRRGRIARLLERFRHSHYPARMTWTMDNSPWRADPNALEYCECGARRRLWGPSEWTQS